MTQHPQQPITLDADGVARFRPNAIVLHLLENGGIDMNALMYVDFDDADRRQFAQLIGYSVDGYGDLSYCDGGIGERHWSVYAADEIADGLRWEARQREGNG